MFTHLEAETGRALAAYLLEKYGLTAPVVTEQPKDPSFGELALPAAFALAKQLRKAPKMIAEELAAPLRALPGIAAVEVAGAGYLNLRFDQIGRASCRERV